MLQGTGSDVGKSLLVAGLCRAYARRGLRVRPFKPQNMSNNAAVTVDGGEIGRAQALQARACGIEPVTDMNPVLLKPQDETGAQIVVHGKVFRNAKAREYYKLKSSLLPCVTESFERLSGEADLVLVEGAGSAAEINLRAGDIANMGFAQATQTPVGLVGDIDRGGVIASLVGTMELLSTTERELVSGYIINRFRGDVSLFDSGIEALQKRTGLACFGVVPFFHDAKNLPAEDSMNIGHSTTAVRDATLRVVIPVLSRISNFDDFDPLIAEPDVEVEFIEAGRALPGNADLVVLPGSKATIADLRFVRRQGWDIDIAAHLRRGGWLLGVCAGYQMLGTSVSDPTGIEGSACLEPGLGLMDMHTVLDDGKTLELRHGVHRQTGQPISGYEMHIGTTTGKATNAAMLELAGRPDGAVSADGKTMGCYLHGMFSSDAFRHAFLNSIRSRAHSGLGYEDRVENTLNALAVHLEATLDLDAILAIANRTVTPAPHATVQTR